jgi:hypothetical protein
MAAYSMMFMGVAPFGALGAGTAAHRLGAPLAVTIGGVAAIVGGLLFAVRLPRLRVSARALLAARKDAGGEPPEAATPPLARA